MEDNEYAWRVDLAGSRVGRSSRSVAYQVAASLLPLGKPAVIRRYDGDEWRLYGNVEADDPPLAVMLLARWKALKDYLGEQIDADHAVMQSFADYPDGGLTSKAHGCLVAANRNTLAKMRELEAGR